MSFLERLLRNHPLANILFAVVLLLGLSAYLHMPREQDPEINFNWVNIITDAARRLGRGRREARHPAARGRDQAGGRHPLRALQQPRERVVDPGALSRHRRSACSTSASTTCGAKSRTRRRASCRSRCATTRASSRSPPRTAFPPRRCCSTGQADDETLRRAGTRDPHRPGAARRASTRCSRSACTTRSCRSSSTRVALAARGLNAADVADAVGGLVPRHLRRQGARRRRRLAGARHRPGRRSRLPRAHSRSRVPARRAARADRRRGRGRARAGRRRAAWPRPTVEPAVLLSVTKKSHTNTLELVERIHAYIAEQEPAARGRTGLQLALTDDQTMPTREAIGVMESQRAARPDAGARRVLAVPRRARSRCWSRSASRSRWPAASRCSTRSASRSTSRCCSAW